MTNSRATEKEPGQTQEAGRSLYDVSLDVVMTGVAIIVPLVITVYVLRLALEFIIGALMPFVDFLQWIGLIGWFERVEVIAFLIEVNMWQHIVSFFTEAIAVTVLFGIVILVGSIGHHRQGKRIIGIVDLAITSIPGLGTVYNSFRRMGDVMLDTEAENFQEVKLVQCLDEDMYVLGFETSSSPESVEAATGHDDMVTVFLPLAPNPVTGGFLTHVPREQVIDVDMTIEEGVRSILTSGVASGTDETAAITMDDVEAITDFETLQDAVSPDDRGDERGRS